jgi:hypothetical protein
MRLRQPHVLSLQHIRRTGKPQTSEGGNGSDEAERLTLLDIKSGPERVQPDVDL